MIVYFIAAAETLIYLCAVPICAAFCLRTEGGLRFGAGIGAFERRFALNRARRIMRYGRSPKSRRGAGGAKLAWQIIRRARIQKLSLRGSLSLGDAAATAMACGSLSALGCALKSAVPEVDLDVSPLFGDSEFHAELQGMIAIRSGQIIVAAARGGIGMLAKLTSRQSDDIAGRIAQWINTRLKAS